MHFIFYICVKDGIKSSSKFEFIVGSVLGKKIWICEFLSPFLFSLHTFKRFGLMSIFMFDLCSYLCIDWIFPVCPILTYSCDARIEKLSNCNYNNIVNPLSLYVSHCACIWMHTIFNTLFSGCCRIIKKKKQ